MNDHELRGLFSEMRDDAVPVESMARVRMAVTERVEARRRLFGMNRVGLGWKVAAALAVGGCVTAVMFNVRTVAPVQQRAAQPAVVVEQAAPVQAAPVQVAPVQVAPVQVTSPKPVVRKARAAVKHVEPAPMEGGASEIRIESPLEPDVVIVLIGG